MLDQLPAIGLPCGTSYPLLPHVLKQLHSCWCCCVPTQILVGGTDGVAGQ